MIDLLAIGAFNAAYAQAIDSDALAQWPGFFTEDCHYRVTHHGNEPEGLEAGITYADLRDMLHDRIAALREAHIYERQRYRHVLGMPVVQAATADTAEALTPFIVVRIMATGQRDVFATGVYRDRFPQPDGRLRLALGDPTGIGPEIALKALAVLSPPERERITVVGPGKVLERTASALKLEALLGGLSPVEVGALPDAAAVPGPTGLPT